MTDMPIEQQDPAPPADTRKNGRGRMRYVQGVYRYLLQSTFLGTLVIILCIGAPLLVFHFKFQTDAKTVAPSLLLVVTMCGALGAMFSYLLRLYNFKDLPRIFDDDQMPRIKVLHLIVYGLVPPFVGAVSAAVLYVSFAGGMLGGDVFPKFDCALPPGPDQAKQICKTFENLIENYSPTDAKEYAKALVWGFIAGFSERLIPDTLASFATKVASQG